MKEYKVVTEKEPDANELDAMILMAARFNAQEVVVEVDGKKKIYSVKEYMSDGREVLKD
jgi:Iap family predicted aminopeptidase